LSVESAVYTHKTQGWLISILVGRGGSTIGFPGKCNIFHKINRFLKSVKTKKCYGICLKKFEEKKFRVQNVHPGFI